MPHVMFNINEKKPVAIRVSDDVANRIADFIARRKCLSCHVELQINQRYVRGLCGNCYQTARNVMEKGEKSEADLIRAGLLAGSTGGGRPARSAFRKRLAEL
jgi:predicted RNA-binding Zn-ribbon protein involved in translation (DUF1610 family)